MTRQIISTPDTDVINEHVEVPRPARCVSRIEVDRPGLLVSLAMVAVLDDGPAQM